MTLTVEWVTTVFISLVRLSDQVLSQPSLVLCVRLSLTRSSTGEITTNWSTVHHRSPTTYKGKRLLGGNSFFKKNYFRTCLDFESEAEIQNHYLRFHKPSSGGLPSSSVAKKISHRMKRFFTTMPSDNIYDASHFRISCRKISCSLHFDSGAEMMNHYFKTHC